MGEGKSLFFMKYLLILMLLPAVCVGQDLIKVKNTLTGKTHEETTWRILNKKMLAFGGVHTDCRIVKYSEDDVYLDLKLVITGREAPIAKGDKLGFYLNGVKEPLILECTESNASNPRSNRKLYFYPRYKTSLEDLETIYKHKVEKVVIQTQSRSYTDKIESQLYEIISLILTGKYPSGKEPKKLTKTI